MRAFGANGYRLRDTRVEIRLIYTGFLVLVLVGMATLAALQIHLIGWSPAALAAYYRGGDIGEAMSFGKSFRQLVETTHFHAFIMGVVYLVLAHLFVATPLRASWKRIMIVLAFAGLLGDLIAPWLICYAAASFAYLLIASWVAQWIGFGAFIVVPIREMWFVRPDGEIPPE